MSCEHHVCPALSCSVENQIEVAGECCKVCRSTYSVPPKLHICSYIDGIFTGFCLFRYGLLRDPERLRSGERTLHQPSVATHVSVQRGIPVERRGTHLLRYERVRNNKVSLRPQMPSEQPVSQHGGQLRVCVRRGFRTRHRVHMQT